MNLYELSGTIVLQLLFARSPGKLKLSSAFAVVTVHGELGIGPRMVIVVSSWVGNMGWVVYSG